MTYHGIPSGILSDILSGISSHMSSGILSGISSGILSDILSGILSGISSGILSGRWGPAVPTELGRSQVEVWARKVPGWTAVPTGLGRSLVEVQRCPLGSEGPWLRPTALGTLRLRLRRPHADRQPAVEAQQCPLPQKLPQIGEELARRKWTWEGVDAEVVEEKLEDEEEREEEEEEENNCGKI